MRAAIAFDLGRAGMWGLYLDSGRGSVTATGPHDPSVVVRTTPEVLADLVTARRPGYDAFLDGELDVRGNLSLALELESLFDPPHELPPGWPVTVHVKVGRNRWSILLAGPPEAPPVVLLHGLGASKVTFLPTVRALAKDHRVLAVDLPGFGDSAKPVAPYDAPWFADRVIELLDALDIKQAAFVGNSMGGRISIELGFRYPERSRALVLLAPALAFLRFRQIAPVVRFARPELGAIPLKPRRRMVLSTIRSIFAHPERVPEHWFEAAADEFLRVLGKPRGRIAFLAAARNIYLDEPHGDTGFWKRLATLDVPAQFVFGKRDPLIPVSFATYVADALPDARIAILDDCGHVPQLEEPDTVHRLTRQILGASD